MVRPRILICPVKRLYGQLACQVPERCAAVLSSSSDLAADRLWGLRYVFRRYEDVDWEEEGRSFSRRDAAAFAAFIRDLGPEVDTIYCCCDAGESRSPAVAAAVCRHFGLDDALIWHDPHYHPNMLVFDLLTQALGCPVTDQEKDMLLYENRQAFRDAIRKARQ